MSAHLTSAEPASAVREMSRMPSPEQMATPELMRPTPTDFVVVALLLFFGSLNLFLSLSEPENVLGFDPVLVGWANYLVFGVLVLPVPWRRQYPVLVGLWVGVGFGVFRLFQVPEGLASSIALFLVIQAAGTHITTRVPRDVVRTLALVSGAVAFTVSLLRDLEAVSFDTAIALLFGIGLNTAFYIAAWMLGDASRRKEQDQAELARRAELLLAGQERAAQLAVQEERVRIARELHDVVAHHVSVMGVQAAAARRVMAVDVTRAGEVLEQVEGSGRRAIEEMQRLLGLLRDQSDATEPTSEDDATTIDQPQPTLDELPTLLDTVRSAGMTVDLRKIGATPPMPASFEVSIYRIVQEALTNAMRHAPGASVTVVQSHLSDAFSVQIINGAPSADHRAQAGSRPVASGGRGLVGIRERAALLGGSVQTGPTAHGGWQVVATLPVAGPARRDGLPPPTDAPLHLESGMP